MNRKILIILLVILIGCKKSGDDIVEVIPLAPTELKATLITNNQVKLEWKDNSTNETGYKIERKTDLTSFTEIATITSDITTYTDNAILINTNYTYRVYSYNKVGKSLNYSNEASIKTLNTPTLSTSTITEVTSSSAKSGGNISSDGGSSVTSRGVVWSTTPSPTIALTTKTENGTGIGIFSSSISGLSPNTKYYVRAYATNSVGTGYGNELILQTINIPVIITNSFSNVMAYSAVSGGNISSDGGAVITSRGVVWSTQSNPTIALTTKTNDGAGIGPFSSNISGLTQNTKYYVKAFATNSAGTAYGNELVFTTLPPTQFTYGTVTSKTGRVWLDRNLGATQVATSETDDKSFGDLYQWGRSSDGHQIRTSPTTNIQSSTDIPGHGMFIIVTTGPATYYWRYPKNDNLWQGVNGINNPCPSGFRLPTLTEWQEEINTWDITIRNRAFLSPLKLPSGGHRDFTDGKLLDVGSRAFYWSSNFSGLSGVEVLAISPAGSGNMTQNLNVRGLCVRCIKN